MIAVVNYDKLEALPPVMSLLLTLKRLGIRVYFIGMESVAGRAFLQSNAIPFEFLPPVRRFPQNRIVDYLYRAPSFLPRRRFLKDTLDKLLQEDPDLVVWFQQVKSAALLGEWCFRYRNRVLTFFELYDRIGINWVGFDFDRFVQTSKIVVPEYNRAWMLKECLKLAKLPFVVANKPCEELIHKDLEPPDSVNKIVVCTKGRPLFLYQGAVVSDRQDVITVIETIARHRKDYVVAILSNETSETIRLSDEYTNIFYHPLIPAPYHLTLTKSATVGIAVYKGVGSTLGRLNAAYCAPNKIYEYAAFGVPTLGNSIPGLKYSVEWSGAGLCCGMDKDSILACADRLVDEHVSFSAKALEFYRSCDLSAQVSLVLNHVINFSK